MGASVFKYVVFIVGVVSTMLSGRPADSQELTVLPRHRVVYNTLLGMRYNSGAVSLLGDLGYRFRLYTSGEPLKRNAHLGIGAFASVNPSFSRVGAKLTLSPLTIVVLDVGYTYHIWHGVLGAARSYRYVDENYFADLKDMSGGDVTDYVTTGHELFLALTLQAALGPFVFVNKTDGLLTRHRLNAGDRLYYSPRFDVLAPNNGWFMQNNTDAVFVTPIGLIPGIRASVVHAFYRDRDFESGERHDITGVPTVSLGPLVAYTFFDRPGASFNKPTLLLIVAWWLRHPYRTGQEVNRGVPVTTLAFKFEGDIWSRD